MQVFAHVPLKTMRSVGGRRQSNYHSDWYTVVKLYGPVHESHERGAMGRGYIFADIEISEALRPHVSMAEFREDGLVRVRIWVNTHRKTLSAFLASGDLEWDLREIES
jgi:hypothetical protein